MERELIGWFFTAREPISWEAEAASRRQASKLRSLSATNGADSHKPQSGRRRKSQNCIFLSERSVAECALEVTLDAQRCNSLSLCSHSHFLLEMQHMFELKRPSQGAHLRPPDPASKQGRGVGATPGGGKLR